MRFFNLQRNRGSNERGIHPNELTMYNIFHHLEYKNPDIDSVFYDLNPPKDFKSYGKLIVNCRCRKIAISEFFIPHNIEKSNGLFLFEFMVKPNKKIKTHLDFVDWLEKCAAGK